MNKIAPGSPVFIGENDVDISAALNGCHTIAWWQNGTSRASPPAKNLTIYELNSVSETIYHYNVSPEIFNGYTGAWYCEDKLQNPRVFDIRDPQIALTVWDMDHDLDVTGKTIPRATNITYRIETNLYPVLNYLNRPNANPSDGFFTIKLTDPLNRNIPNIYTGSYGGANTLILPFDTNPYVSSSPYLWKNGNTWDHAARNIQGDPVYPPGTYTFTLSQNLNHMQESFASGSGTGLAGKTISIATVTFPAADPFVVPTTVVTVAPALPEVTPSAPATPAPATSTAMPTATPVAKKTTYAPLPAWIALLGVGICGFFIIVRRNN
ncbi:MAG: DUF3821 domain-containing protein [Methanoregula sp.]|nr:DUF3821 domain-containing protein [Methanoregula sp.]